MRLVFLFGPSKFLLRRKNKAMVTNCKTRLRANGFGWYWLGFAYDARRRKKLFQQFKSLDNSQTRRNERTTAIKQLFFIKYSTGSAFTGRAASEKISVSLIQHLMLIQFVESLLTKLAFWTHYVHYFVCFMRRKLINSIIEVKFHAQHEAGASVWELFFHFI